METRFPELVALKAEELGCTVDVLMAGEEVPRRARPQPARQRVPRKSIGIEAVRTALLNIHTRKKAKAAAALAEKEAAEAEEEAKDAEKEAAAENEVHLAISGTSVDP